MSLVRFRPEAPQPTYLESGNLVPGSVRCGCSSSGRAPPCQGGGSEFEPRHPLQNHKERLPRVPYFIWYRGQVVRQRSAKPSFPSSNLGGTSNSTSFDRKMSNLLSIIEIIPLQEQAKCDIINKKDRGCASCVMLKRLYGKLTVP